MLQWALDVRQQVKRAACHSRARSAVPESVTACIVRGRIDILRVGSGVNNDMYLIGPRVPDLHDVHSQVVEPLLAGGHRCRLQPPVAGDVLR